MGWCRRCFVWAVLTYIKCAAAEPAWSNATHSGYYGASASCNYHVRAANSFTVHWRRDDKTLIGSLVLYPQQATAWYSDSNQGTEVEDLTFPALVNGTRSYDFSLNSSHIVIESGGVVLVGIPLTGELTKLQSELSYIHIQYISQLRMDCCARKGKWSEVIAGQTGTMSCRDGSKGSTVRVCLSSGIWDKEDRGVCGKMSGSERLELCQSANSDGGVTELVADILIDLTATVEYHSQISPAVLQCLAELTERVSLKEAQLSKSDHVEYIERALYGVLKVIDITKNVMETTKFPLESKTKVTTAAGRLGLQLLKHADSSYIFTLPNTGLIYTVLKSSASGLTDGGSLKTFHDSVISPISPPLVLIEYNNSILFADTLSDVTVLSTVLSVYSELNVSEVQFKTQVNLSTITTVVCGVWNTSALTWEATPATILSHYTVQCSLPSNATVAVLDRSPLPLSPVLAMGASASYVTMCLGVICFLLIIPILATELQRCRKHWVPRLWLYRTTYVLYLTLVLSLGFALTMLSVTIHVVDSQYCTPSILITECLILINLNMLLTALWFNHKITLKQHGYIKLRSWRMLRYVFMSIGAALMLTGVHALIINFTSFSLKTSKTCWLDEEFSLYFYLPVPCMVLLLCTALSVKAGVVRRGGQSLALLPALLTALAWCCVPWLLTNFYLLVLFLVSLGQGSVILVVQMLTLLNYTKRTKHTSSTPSAPSISLPPLPASHKDCYCIPNHLQGHDCNLGHVQDDDCNMDSVGGCDGSSEHSNYAAFVEGSVHSVVDRTLYNLEGSSSTNMNSVGGVDGSSKLPTISNSVGGVTSLPDTSVLAHNDSSQTATDSTSDL